MTFAEVLLDLVTASIVALPLRQFVEDVSAEVQAPFIDEIFHYPQLQRILSGDYTTWDPKITTPPGLYYLTAALAKVFGDDGPGGCSLARARLFNFAGAVFIVGLTVLIRTRSRNGKTDPGFSSAAILLNPLLSIYYSLYYTDVWATVFVVAAYTIIVWRPLNNFFITSSLASILMLLSLTMRQTNIIWCAFLSVILLDDMVIEEKSRVIMNNPEEEKKNTALAEDADVPFHELVFDTLSLYIKTALANVVSFIPIALVFAAFGTFVYLNGGLALGDKENHVLVPHLAQMCYCMTFLAVFTVPLWLSTDFISSYVSDNFLSLNGLIFNAAWVPILFIIVENFTIVHPFLLADNRHYAFYIVRHFILRSEHARLQLIPVYHVAFYAIFKLLKNRVSSVISCAFFLLTAICVTSSPLFEPRYYIVPYVFLRLLSAPSTVPLMPGMVAFRQYNTQIRYVLEIVWLWMWTQALYVLFLQFTFPWPDLAEPQRLVW